VAILLNPPADRLGFENAILWGRGRSQYHVREFPGPLSIKAVLRGTAQWTAGRARFDLDAASYLVLNHDQPYSITIDSSEPVETLCLFFARGFVEDAWRSLTSPAAALLDDPTPCKSIEVFETLRRRDRGISKLLTQIHCAISSGARDQADPLFYEAALRVCGMPGEFEREIARVPALRASTREELHRRLHLGKQALDEMFDRNLDLAEIARMAHLSPFHFHRAFAAVFKETPHAYRNRRRLDRAARLLAETEQSVLDICLESGFASPASFATLFARRYQLSPRAFRRFARSEKNPGVFYSTMLP
jgi:AraC family transcriptional regulator